MKPWLILAVAAFATTAGVVVHADEKIGIVLLHGKQGGPFGRTDPASDKTSLGAPLVADLEQVGYLVAQPEMCWSVRRSLDKAYDDCMAEIGLAVADLKSHGATQIVVAGQSQGGNAAIAYGASHPELAGIIAMAPADDPATRRQQPNFRSSLNKAERLVDAGKGNELTDFDDVNSGPKGLIVITIRTTPNNFLSFYGPNSPMVIPLNTTKLKVPLLWIAGDDDPSQRGGASYAFDKAPSNPMSRYVTVHANHVRTPDAGRQTILAWLADLAKAH